jgi:hypothetical protein
MMSVDCSGVGEVLVKAIRKARRKVREARYILVIALVLIVR